MEGSFEPPTFGPPDDGEIFQRTPSSEGVEVNSGLSASDRISPRNSFKTDFYSTIFISIKFNMPSI